MPVHCLLWVILAVHACACVHTISFSHPASSPVLAVLVYFISPLSPPGQEQTVALSVLLQIFLPFRGSGGWENVGRNVRPSPGSPASVSSHY